MNRTEYQVEWEINEDGDIQLSTPEDVTCLTPHDLSLIAVDVLAFDLKQLRAGIERERDNE